MIAYNTKRGGHVIPPSSFYYGQTLWMAPTGKKGPRKKYFGLGPGEFASEVEYRDLKRRKMFGRLRYDFIPVSGVNSNVDRIRDPQGFVDNPMQG